MALVSRQREELLSELGQEGLSQAGLRAAAGELPLSVLGMDRIQA